jgi:hypothetical protein
VKEYYDRVLIVYIPEDNMYGTVEQLGAFASNVKYKKNEVEHEELLGNEEFIIMDEMVFTHVEEDKNG